MGAPYQSTTPVGYNANPPPDDGSTTEANRGKWATIKTKIGDPLNTWAASINSAISTAFGKMPGGGGITNTAVNYTVQSSDQGKLVRATAGSITITTPSATSVGAPFVFSVINDGATDIIIDGSGTETIDGDLTVVIPPNSGMMLDSDGTNWFSYGQNFQRTLVPPQGYLTLLSVATNPLSPIPATNVVAATSVFYRPFIGNLLPISSGTLFAIREFSELTLTLAAQHLASSIYDIFAFDDAGTIRIGTGPPWSTVTAGSCARGTGAGTTELTLLKGMPVNTEPMTVRNGASTFTVAASCGTFLGSIHMDGTNGQASTLPEYGQSRIWGLSNAYNTQRLCMLAGDATASWTPGNVLGSVNSAAGNTARVFHCLAREWTSAIYHQFGNVSAANATSDLTIGIGLNVTNAISGKRGNLLHTNNDAAATINNRGDEVASFRMSPRIGINNLNMLETGTGTRTHAGGADDCVMEVTWQG